MKIVQYSLFEEILMCHVVSRRIFLKFELTLILSNITLSTVSLALNQGAWKKSETDDRVKIAC